MTTDFREERKWKLVTAMTLASCVREWHEADEAGRKELCIRPRPPRLLTDEADGELNGDVAVNRAASEAMEEEVGAPAEPSVVINGEKHFLYLFEVHHHV